MIVYRHRRPDTKKVFYVGIGSREDRAYTNHGRSGLWNNIVNKAGYEVEILRRDLLKKEAVELEKFLIQEYDGELCNFTEGGEVGALGYKHTPEAIEKISKASKSRIYPPKSKETKEKLRQSRLGSKWAENQYSVHNKPVIQCTKEGQIIKEWKSAEEAGKTLKINSGNICSCRNGKRKSAGGYVWKHKNI